MLIGHWRISWIGWGIEWDNLYLYMRTRRSGIIKWYCRLGPVYIWSYRRKDHSTPAGAGRMRE